jgi:hypothetical protein
MHAPGRSCLRGLRARARMLLAVVLPALVLRALIPFGFMPVAGHGGPAMQLCPGAAAMAGAASGHPHHEGTGTPEGSAHALCVFAASAAPAVARVAPTMPLAALSATLAARQETSSLLLPSILRTQCARAPPARA